MIIALPVLGFSVVASLFIRRLKVDVEQEKTFRAQLKGLRGEQPLVSAV